MKFQRAFWMQVQGQSQTWTFQSPLTLELEIERGIWQSLSNGTFRIYNLADSTRSDIYQDWLEQGDFRQITVRAGYRSWTTAPGPMVPIVNQAVSLQALPVIFLGNIKQAYSQREGSSWVTTIAAWDGGYGVTEGNMSEDQTTDIPLNDIVDQIISAMPHVSLGYLDPSLTLSNYRGVALQGSPWTKLCQLADSLYADVFIDLEKVYMVAKGSAVPNISGGLGTISPAQGLLDTPMKQKSIVSFTMLFEPRVKVGQAVVLQSIETVNNGTYTVGGISHNGLISDAVDGECRTKISCFYAQNYQPYGEIQ